MREFDRRGSEGFAVRIAVLEQGIGFGSDSLAMLGLGRHGVHHEAERIAKIHARDQRPPSGKIADSISGTSCGSLVWRLSPVVGKVSAGTRRAGRAVWTLWTRSISVSTICARRFMPGVCSMNLGRALMMWTVRRAFLEGDQIVDDVPAYRRRGESGEICALIIRRHSCLAG